MIVIAHKGSPGKQVERYYKSKKPESKKSKVRLYKDNAVQPKQMQVD